jgi:hypothetical protein
MWQREEDDREETITTARALAQVALHDALLHLRIDPSIDPVEWVSKAARYRSVHGGLEPEAARLVMATWAFAVLRGLERPAGSNILTDKDQIERGLHAWAQAIADANPTRILTQAGPVRLKLALGSMLVNAKRQREET